MAEQFGNNVQINKDETTTETDEFDRDEDHYDTMQRSLWDPVVTIQSKKSVKNVNRNLSTGLLLKNT